MDQYLTDLPVFPFGSLQSTDVFWLDRDVNGDQTLWESFQVPVQSLLDSIPYPAPSNLYNNDGTISSNRVVNGNSKNLQFFSLSLFDLESQSIRLSSTSDNYLDISASGISTTDGPIKILTHTTGQFKLEASNSIITGSSSSKPTLHSIAPSGGIAIKAESNEASFNALLKQSTYSSAPIGLNIETEYMTAPSFSGLTFTGIAMQIQPHTSQTGQMKGIAMNVNGQVGGTYPVGIDMQITGETPYAMRINSQYVGLQTNAAVIIGSSSPINFSTAILEIFSTTKGVYQRPMTSTQGSAISSPPSHLVINVSNTNADFPRVGTYSRIGSKWRQYALFEEDPSYSITINASAGANFSDTRLIGASSIEMLVMDGSIMQAPISFTSSTGTINSAVSGGEIITVFFKR